METIDYTNLEKVIFNILDNYFNIKEKSVADITFKQLCLIFFDKANRDKKLSTISTYQSIYSCHIENSIVGKTSLINLNNSMFDKFIDVLLLKNLSAKRIGDIIVFIKSVLNFAKAEKLMQNIDFNIVSPRTEKKEMRVLSIVEQKKLEEYVYTHLEDTTCLGTLICLKTGIRLGELCSLKWDNLDLNNGVLKVRNTIQRIKNPDIKATKKTILHVDTPKSLNSHREIPIPKDLLAILKSFYMADLSACYVLTGTDMPQDPHTMQERFKRLIRHINISRANFHSTRHTFATRAVEAGMDIKTLSVLLGHSSVKITLDRYVHISIQQKLKQIEKMGAA